MRICYFVKNLTIAHWKKVFIGNTMQIIFFFAQSLCCIVDNNPLCCCQNRPKRIHAVCYIEKVQPQRKCQWRDICLLSAQNANSIKKKWPQPKVLCCSVWKIWCRSFAALVPQRGEVTCATSPFWTKEKKVHTFLKEYHSCLSEHYTNWYKSGLWYIQKMWWYSLEEGSENGAT